MTRPHIDPAQIGRILSADEGSWLTDELRLADDEDRGAFPDFWAIIMWGMGAVGVALVALAVML